MNTPFKHIVLIGYGGFIGSHLTRYLKQTGSVQTLSLISRNGVVVKSSASELAMSYQHWLENQSQDSIDVVIYLAWDSTPYSSHTSAEKQSNLDVCMGYFDVLRKFICQKIIFMSSGGALYRSADMVTFDETSHFDIQTPYAQEKIQAENYIAELSSHDVYTHTILRPSNVYGPNQTLKLGMGVIPYLFNAMLEGDTARLYEDLESTRDYIFVNDFIAAIVACLDDLQCCGTYNVSSQQNTSLAHLVKTISGVGQKTLLLEVEKTLPSNFGIISSEKFRHDFRWESPTTFHSGISQVWELDYE